MTAQPPDDPVAARRPRMGNQQRRDQIVRCARTVFAREGLAGARTRDIAAEAGINEATLYRHFSSKDELFEAAVVTPLEEAVGRLVESSGSAPGVASPQSAVQRQQSRDFVFELCSVMREIAPLIGIVLFANSDVAKRYYTDRIQPALSQVQRVIELNYDSWPHRPFDPEMIVQWAFGMAWITAVTDELSGRPRDLDVVADRITDLFFDGLVLPDEPDE